MSQSFPFKYADAALWQWPRSHQPTVYWWVWGVCLTLLYGVTKIHFDEVARIAEPLLALTGLWCVARYGQGVGRSMAFGFLWAIILIQLLSWVGSQFFHPDWAEPYPKIDRMARGFVCLLVAWWLGGFERNVLVFWGLVALTVVLSPWIGGGGWQEFVAGLNGERINMGIRNAQHTGFFYGIVAIGLAVFAPRLMQKGRYRVLRVSMWALVFVMVLFVVVLSQTRAAWLGLGLCVIFSGMILAWQQRRYWAQQRFIVSALGILILLAILVWGSYDILAKRLMTESGVISQLLSGHIQSLPYSSIGIRIHSWNAAWEFIQQRPLLGWGGNGRALVMEHTAWLPEAVRNEFGHLHNIYIEMWVNYGVLGLVWYFAWLSWLCWQSYRAWQRGDLAADMMLFMALFVIFWSCMNAFEAYLNFWTGVFAFNVVIGGILTLIWKPYWHKIRPNQSSGAGGSWGDESLDGESLGADEPLGR